MPKELVMDKEQLKKYVFERKLHPDPEKREEQLSNLNFVIIHNAHTTQEVEELLCRARVSYERFTPKKSAEAHFYNAKEGMLHLVNSRGVIRHIQDTNLIEALSDILDRKIKFEIEHYMKDPAKASRRFHDFAFNLVADIFEKLDSKEIEKQGNLNLVFGPHASLPIEKVDVIFESKNDYLNYKILKFQDKIIVAFDYIFADQAKNVLNHISQPPVDMIKKKNRISFIKIYELSVS